MPCCECLQAAEAEAAEGVSKTQGGAAYGSALRGNPENQLSELASHFNSGVSICYWNVCVSTVLLLTDLSGLCCCRPT